MAKRIHARRLIEASCGPRASVQACNVIDLSYSNRTEPLLDALAENVAATQPTLYDPVCLLVPERIRRELREAGAGAAARHRRARRVALPQGVPARRRRGERARAAHRRSRRRSKASCWRCSTTAGAWRWRDAGGRARLPVDPTTRDDDARRRSTGGARSWRRSSRELFDEYAYSRPEMLAAWRKGAPDRGLGRAAATLAARAVAGAVRPRRRRCRAARRRPSPTSSRARRPTRCACPARRTSSASRSSRGCIDRSSRRSGARRRCSSTR